MEIGGIEPFTLTDFPGKVAAVIFLRGCNFSCPFCHNSSLISKTSGHLSSTSESSDIPGVKGDNQSGLESGSIEQCLEFLQGRRGRLQGVVISGGEPTIHGDLSDLLQEIKEMDFAVKLDTNGSQPDHLLKLIEKGLLDFIAMDIKAPWHKYDQLSGVKTDISRIKRSMQIITESGLPHLFRTTMVPDLLDQEDIQEITLLIPEGSPYKVQPYRDPS